MVKTDWLTNPPDFPALENSSVVDQIINQYNLDQYPIHNFQDIEKLANILNSYFPIQYKGKRFAHGFLAESLRTVASSAFPLNKLEQKLDCKLSTYLFVELLERKGIGSYLVINNLYNHHPVVVVNINNDLIAVSFLKEKPSVIIISIETLERKDKDPNSIVVSEKYRVIFFRMLDWIYFLRLQFRDFADSHFDALSLEVIETQLQNFHKEFGDTKVYKSWYDLFILVKNIHESEDLYTLKGILTQYYIFE